MQASTKIAYAVYDSIAIYGVGKTPRSARTDSKQWVNNPNSVFVIPCSIEVLQGIKNDTIQSDGHGYNEVSDTTGSRILVTTKQAEDHSSYKVLGDALIME